MDETGWDPARLRAEIETHTATLAEIERRMADPIYRLDTPHHAQLELRSKEYYVRAALRRCRHRLHMLGVPETAATTPGPITDEASVGALIADSMAAMTWEQRAERLAELVEGGFVDRQFRVSGERLRKVAPAWVRLAGRSLPPRRGRPARPR